MFKLKLFSREVSSPWKVFILGSPWILARTDGGRNHYVMFVPYYLHKFLNLCISQTKELSQLQKQPPEVFYRKSCSYKFRNIHRKTPSLETLFNTVASAGLKTCNCIKRDFNKVFFCEYCENFKNTNFQENLQITFSAVPASYSQYFFLGASFCS